MVELDQATLAAGLGNRLGPGTGHRSAVDRARARIAQIFRYLKALEEYRNPPKTLVKNHSWTLWRVDLPNHPLVRWNAHPGEVLGVSRPEPSQEESQPPAAEGQAEAALVMALYEKLFALRDRLRRDGDRIELVLGDGLLSWHGPNGAIHHPILLQRVWLEFDPGIPQFRVVEASPFVELESTLLRMLPHADGVAIAWCREQILGRGVHPLNAEPTSAFLRELITQLAPRGEFIGESVPTSTPAPGQPPRIGRAPLLFLRDRSQGGPAAIDNALASLALGEHPPTPLVQIVGLSTRAEGSLTSTTTAPMDREILLGKPANLEQSRIARALMEHRAVLVQGPPGTGKTHTIANLIGAFLAQGQSVLVTSHAAKALRVLREQVAEPLRALCVQVLEDDLQGRQDLEAAIESIEQHLNTLDHRALAEEADRIAEEIETLRERRAALDAPVKMSGQVLEVTEAIRCVQAGPEHHWLAGPIDPDAEPPLTAGELLELQQLLASLQPEPDLNLEVGEPEFLGLPSPDEFERQIAELHALRTADRSFGACLWHDRQDNDASQVESLRQAHATLRQAVEMIATEPSWALPLIAAGRGGARTRAPWEALLRQVETVAELAEGSEAIALSLQPVPPDADDIPWCEQDVIARELIEHLNQRGNLGWSVRLGHARWAKWLEASRVLGRSPRSSEEIEAVRIEAELHAALEELVERWDALAGQAGVKAPADLQPRQRISFLRALAPSMRACLEWHSRFLEPARSRLESLGFRWEAFQAHHLADASQPDAVVAFLNSHGPGQARFFDLFALRTAVLGPLQHAVESRVARSLENQHTRRIEELKNHLANLARTSATWSRLRQALAVGDVASYQAAWLRLWRFHAERPDRERLQRLMARIETIAPAWAKGLHRRAGLPANLPLDQAFPAAWRQARIISALERRGVGSLADLENLRGRIDQEIRRLTTRRIECLAWSRQAARVSAQQRQALVSWLTTVRKIGKGHGKRVPELLREAARLMHQCREAVPVWIMPLARVLETFDPRVTRFDVVILDEASQCDLMGLLALNLAQSAIVVGDHQQVSPSAVGHDPDAVGRLIDEHLGEIPGAHLYDGLTSLYDLARQAFPMVIGLREHFRCAPEIIAFSNALCYDGRIVPRRTCQAAWRVPPVVAHRVEGAVCRDQLNRREALEIAALLVAACEHEAYRDATFGVIAMVGAAQALEIEKRIRGRLDPREYERRRILCGNPAHFQGDERDVIFLSLVDSDSQSGNTLALRQQTAFLQRYNVAASRARDQLWVVHSLDPRVALKPDDLRRRLIEHAEHHGQASGPTLDALRARAAELTRAWSRTED